MYRYASMRMYRNSCVNEACLSLTLIAGNSRPHRGGEFRATHRIERHWLAKRIET